MKDLRAFNFNNGYSGFVWLFTGGLIAAVV